MESKYKNIAARDEEGQQPSKKAREKQPGKYHVMGHLGHEQFLFYFLLFSDFIGILFSFSFLFFVDDEEARDVAVT